MTDAPRNESAQFTLRPLPKAAFVAGYAGLLPQIFAAVLVFSGSEYCTDLKPHSLAILPLELT